MKGKATILIAEDDKQIGTTLLEQLTNQQYDATLVHDGEQALNQLIIKKYDVIVLDLKMPKISGYGILKYIKSTIPATKVIILTAYSDIKNIEECKRLGADYVIGKPYDMELLFWTIELVIAK